MTRQCCWPGWRTEVALDLKPVDGGGRHRLRLALTMAWRDIRRHKARSALIIALIALPIFGMSLAATVGMSTVATSEETAAMELGQTQGRLSPMNAQNSKSIQAVQGDSGGTWGYGAPIQEPDPAFVPSSPAEVVPAGFTTIPWQSTVVRSPVGKAQVEVPTTVTDVLSPAFKGKYTLLDGVAPSSRNHALATRGLLDRLDVKLGEELTTSAGTFEIVGTIRPERQGDGESFLFLNAKQVPASMVADLSPATLYLVGDRALRWADAKAFNAKGVMVTSRSLLLDPPGKAELGADSELLQTDWRYSSILPTLLMAALIGVLALLEVGLLAGAAFAVGARKQQRELALLAASGAESSMVRATVTASGLWLGLAGGMVGAVLGSVAAVLGVLFMQGRGSATFPGLHLMWLPTLGLVLVGVAAGVVAAVIPAHAVAKQATLAALKSGRTVQTASKWSTRIGVGLLILAAVAMTAASAATAAVRGNDTQFLWAPWLAGLVVVGAVLLVISLILMTGRLIEILTRKSSWLPVPLRLAARDSARNRGRTIPAVAAVLAAATLSGALMVGTASTMKNSSDNHVWQLNLNQAAVSLSYQDHAGTEASGAPATAMAEKDLVARVVSDELGAGTRTMLVNGVEPSRECYEDTATPETDSACISWMLKEPLANQCELSQAYEPVDPNDWRCRGPMSSPNQYSPLPAFVVGGEAELQELLGRAPSSEALAALRDGGIVIANKVFLRDDQTATVMSYNSVQQENHPAAAATDSPAREFLRPSRVPMSEITLAAVVEPPEKNIGFYGVVSAETAATLHLPVTSNKLLVTAPTALTEQETDSLNAALAPLLGGYSDVHFQAGPSTLAGVFLWLIVAGGALITLSAAGITAGLALADGRSDHATLASIGADTRLRKALAGSQTLMTAMLGTVLGVFAGTVPTIVVLSQQRGFPIVIPWLQMGALMVLVPLFGAAAAWVLTKGRLPMTRRQTLA